MTFSTFLLGFAALVVAGFFLQKFLARTNRERKDSRPAYLVALGALADADEETAFREFKNAVRSDSSNADAYLRLGELFRRRGDVNRSFQLHRELSTRSSLPREMMARVHMALARDLMALGKPEKAAAAAEESIRLNDAVPGAFETLLQIREALGEDEACFKLKKEMAKRRGGRSLETNRELAAYRARQGMKCLQAGDEKNAERVLKDALRLDAENPEANYGWGLLQEHEANYELAVKAWEGLLEGPVPDDRDLFRHLERAHFLNGSFSRMEQTYGAFLQRFPDHAGASFGLARFLRRKGQWDEALDVCRRGLDAHPEAAELRALYLALLLQSGRTAEAEAAIDRWITQVTGESGSGESRSGIKGTMSSPSRGASLR